VTFYHYTSRVYLPGILREGITRGDIAISPTEGFCAPTLTKSADWQSQVWVKLSGPGTALTKTGVRLTVEIPEAERHRLKTWAQVLSDYRIDPAWEKAQDQAVGTEESWQVFFGKIPPSWISKIEKNPYLDAGGREFEKKRRVWWRVPETCKGSTHMSAT